SAGAAPRLLRGARWRLARLVDRAAPALHGMAPGVRRARRIARVARRPRPAARDPARVLRSRRRGRARARRAAGPAPPHRDPGGRAERGGGGRARDRRRTRRRRRRPGRRGARPVHRGRARARRRVQPRARGRPPPQRRRVRARVGRLPVADGVRGADGQREPGGAARVGRCVRGVVRPAQPQHAGAYDPPSCTPGGRIDPSRRRGRGARHGTHAAGPARAGPPFPVVGDGRARGGLRRRPADMSRTPVPPLLRRRSSDEYAPLPFSDRDRLALARLDGRIPDRARAARTPLRTFVETRRATAATLRAINEAAGEPFYAVTADAEIDAEAANAAFGGGPDAVVVDVQTHLAMPSRLAGPSAEQLLSFLRITDPERWGDGIPPERLSAAEWAGHVFGGSETAVAVLTSTPGRPSENVVTNPEIASCREIVDRYAGTGRLLTHTIVHPNVPGELDAMADWTAELAPDG